MNYKAGAQAGASRCQRHHPAQTFRLVRFILGLMMKVRRLVVNWVRDPSTVIVQAECLNFKASMSQFSNSEFLDKFPSKMSPYFCLSRPPIGDQSEANTPNKNAAPVYM